MAAEPPPGIPLDPLAAENNGSLWQMETRISKKEARARWPERRIEGLQNGDACDGPTAVAHFGAVEIENVGRVELGNFVEVDSNEDNGQWLLEVMELFQDKQGMRQIGVNWFYKHIDTSMKIEKSKGVFDLPYALDAKMIFKANKADNAKYNSLVSVDTVNRLVKIVHRTPGGPIPEDCDFYWSMEHDQRYNTFVDSFTEEPPTKAQFAKAKGPRTLRTLELYCGCGGLSFADRHTEDVVIETRWAVDCERSMIETFKANYPYAHAHIIGVDEFLELCKHYKRICDEYPDSWKARPGPAAPQMAFRDGEWQEISEILTMVIKDKGFRGRGQKAGQGKGHLLQDLREEDTWLEFGVHFKKEGREQWIKEKDLNCPVLMAAFVRELRSVGYLPLPGDVDCIMGGPPCQGLSGLNRHGKTTEIIDDPRNRQVLAFYNTIDWFRPSFVLMENVLDIFKKGDGLYAKMAASILLDMDYQTRTGIIAACHHGAPQGRWRAFMWGAMSGAEQLPPFPEPTHAAGFACGVPASAKECVVGFQSVENYEKAHTMTFMGDVFGDLRDVSTFDSADRSDYGSNPVRPLQHFLRRAPPAWGADKRHRAQAALDAMEPTQADLAFKLRSLSLLPIATMAIGASYLCNKGRLGENEAVGNRTDMFAQETLRDSIRIIAKQDPEAARLIKLEMELSKAGLSRNLGVHVLEQNHYDHCSSWDSNGADGADKDDDEEECEYDTDDDWAPDENLGHSQLIGKVSDHRPLNLNADDYLRCYHVPREKNANFRLFPGVISHNDETCCAGHTHAASHSNGKQTACKGGGTRTLTLTGNTAASRVDHADNGGWRGGALKDCEAYSRFLPTGDLLCPRWCITYKKGRSSGRHGCFGRMWHDEIQPTVVGRAEPHNLRLVHPVEARVVTIRENARCQGFPDYFTFVGIGAKNATSWVRNNSLTSRYQQLGNAVCPMVAEALGRCLAQAALGEAPVGGFVVTTPNLEFDRYMAEARRSGLLSQSQAEGVPEEYQRQIMKMGNIKEFAQQMAEEQQSGDDDGDDDGMDIEVEIDAGMADAGVSMDMD